MKHMRQLYESGKTRQRDEVIEVQGLKKGPANADRGLAYGAHIFKRKDRPITECHVGFYEADSHCISHRMRLFIIEANRRLKFQCFEFPGAFRCLDACKPFGIFLESTRGSTNLANESPGSGSVFNGAN